MKKIMSLLFAAVVAVMGISQGARADVPRPEYPRPQFERSAWVNLNGTWTYSFDFGKTGLNKKWQESKGFDGKITVPFCLESKLSGVQHTDFIDCMWYQRQLDIPAAWDGKKILLNFGAVDYECQIYLDGKKVGQHSGAGSSFTVDLTRQVKAGQSYSLVLRVLDDLRSGRQPGGKQSTNFYSAGCSYTRVTGIWQTVWMEAVDAEGLKSVFAVPDVDQEQLVIRPEFYGENMGNKLVVTVSDGKKVVATKTVPCSNNTMVVLPIKKARLWWPEDPFLYDVTYKVMKGDQVIDEVKSYAGMRKVHCQDGYFYLNNKPYFQRLVLDQGFYPDGIWTAPTDEALKHDIEMSIAVGFNGARLHQKNFEERYYYWADKLGYLTWGEFPSWCLSINTDAAARNILSEWQELVVRDRNHPSIVTWTPLNETWGASNSGIFERMVRDVYNLTKAIDPTRPVNDASGDNHIVTDIWAVHDYARGPELQKHMTFESGKEPYRNVNNDWVAKYDGQPYMLDEFGGLGWIREEDRVGNSWGYGAEIKTKEDFYNILQAEIDAIKASKHVVGFCYTQITDVEQEQNGIYYYDRTPKFDTERIKQIFTTIPSIIENPADLSDWK